MQYKTLAIAFAIAVISQRSDSAEFAIAKGAQNGLCQSALRTIVERKGPIWESGREIAPEISWRTVEYVDSFGFKREAKVADFDIDNDGSDEFLLFGDTMLRTQIVTWFWVFERNGSPDLWADLKSGSQVGWTGVLSDSQAYESEGFLSGEIRPMTYEGRNYVLLMDSAFGFSKGVTTLIAEYRGVALESANYSSKKRGPTDDLRIICKITTTLADDP